MLCGSTQGIQYTTLSAELSVWEQLYVLLPSFLLERQRWGWQMLDPGLPPGPARRAPCAPGQGSITTELSTQPSLPALPSEGTQLLLQPLSECPCLTTPLFNDPPLPTFIHSFILQLL